MSVWLAIPSKRPRDEAQRVIDQWREKGYLTAIWRDRGDETVECDIIAQGEYRGYAHAINFLCHRILITDPKATWIVIGGDDTCPDPGDPAVIASECNLHFRGTFGVMQPTGDRWGENASGEAYIDRVCGSPWLGKDFCRRMYGGVGPLFPRYQHMFVDEELQHVAKKLGVFWQRRDLAHLHKHWARQSGVVMATSCPSFLEEANSASHWAFFKRLFAERQATGFPGHEPTPLRASAV